ncbi:uncharacterized protein BCR38DRAFT_507935 [Pseudomassariella vexata]|uniref:Uncharacterized protein n=1 Tax=Pseudomassariella vexata TaxID=1141098 RepID=A0A1Y2EBG0_9PEZI|nr:uncharacterized protein BCR38DRAFT_507935 [Pseudomassariella vexata]ORY68747.1 hypothetical protein BCR38DRAFT_507935 [Pseudomassariella vexata]
MHPKTILSIVAFGIPLLAHALPVHSEPQKRQDDVSSLLASYMQAQQQMMQAQMALQNAMQQASIQESAAEDKIQKRQGNDSQEAMLQKFLPQLLQQLSQQQGSSGGRRRSGGITQKRQDDATASYAEAQKDMFLATMAAMNAMQAQTTEQEFAQKMNDAVWKTASEAASDKIQ